MLLAHESSKQHVENAHTSATDHIKLPYPKTLRAATAANIVSAGAAARKAAIRAVTEQPVAVMSFRVAVPPLHLNTLVPSVTCTTQQHTSGLVTR